MDQAAELGLGLSTFVSVGNKADISGNDLLSYWEDDPNTDVVLLYLESFGNPRRFAAARAPGRQAQADRRGEERAQRRRAVGPRRRTPARCWPRRTSTVDALFQQAGVIRTDTLERDVRRGDAAGQPAGAGRATASRIVTNAGGLGILCADTCEANGLERAGAGATAPDARCARSCPPRRRRCRTPST